MRLLLAHGFLPVVTSDHGNVEASGCGRPSEGALAELRGERVRVYPDPALRARVSERFPQARQTALAALPDRYYPLAETVGRLLRLQGTVSAAQAQRRVRESLGERETVARAARRVIRAFVDWGLLRETGQRGLYGQGSATEVFSIDLAAWLVNAYLCATPSGKADLDAVLNSPALFSFRLPRLNGPDVVSKTHGRVDVIRHAGNEDLAILSAQRR